MCILLLFYLVCADIAKQKDAFELCLKGRDLNFTDEQRLLTKLMANYNKDTRPVYNASHAVQIKVGLSITQIFDVVIQLC